MITSSLNAPTSMLGVGLSHSCSCFLVFGNSWLMLIQFLTAKILVRISPDMFRQYQTGLAYIYIKLLPIDTCQYQKNLTQNCIQHQNIILVQQIQIFVFIPNINSLQSLTRADASDIFSDKDAYVQYLSYAIFLSYICTSGNFGISVSLPGYIWRIFVEECSENQDWFLLLLRFPKKKKMV